MPATGPAPQQRLSAQQTSHDLLRELLGGVVLAAIESGPCAGSEVTGSVQWRACAVLYQLLTNHPLDRRGRCRSCRYPGEVLGLRRRRCRVHMAAHFYLHHPDDAFLLARMAGEFGLAESAPPGASPVPHQSSAGDTEELPAIEPGRGDSHIAPSQSPAIPPAVHLPGGLPRPGWPDPDQSGAGVRPDRPRLRPDPPDNQAPAARHRSLLLTGDA